MKKIIKDKKHKAILKKGYQQKQLNLFSWKKNDCLKVYKRQKFELPLYWKKSNYKDGSKYKK